VGDKYDRLARVLGATGDLADWMAAFNERLGIPSGLAAMGVTPAMLPAIAEAATKDHCHATNPRPATVADYRAIMEQSMG
jgi:alcohol dehydrogenase class IV